MSFKSAQLQRYEKYLKDKGFSNKKIIQDAKETGYWCDDEITGFPLITRDSHLFDDIFDQRKK